MPLSVRLEETGPQNLKGDMTTQRLSRFTAVVPLRAARPQLRFPPPPARGLRAATEVAGGPQQIRDAFQVPEAHPSVPWGPGMVGAAPAPLLKFPVQLPCTRRPRGGRSLPPPPPPLPPDGSSGILTIPTPAPKSGDSRTNNLGVTPI